MNRPFKPHCPAAAPIVPANTGAAATPHGALPSNRRAEGEAEVSSPVPSVSPTFIGAADSLPPNGPTGGAGASDASTFSLAHPVTAGSQADRRGGASNLSTFIMADGFAYDPKRHGINPPCVKCRRGFYGCICGCPEPEQECFRPALNRDPDWYRIEL